MVALNRARVRRLIRIYCNAGFCNLSICGGVEMQWPRTVCLDPKVVVDEINFAQQCDSTELRECLQPSCSDRRIDWP